MQIGPDLFYKCSTCGNILKNRSLMSGNTFGAIFFSDGRRIAPMLPDIPKLTKCPMCDKILWLNDLEEIARSRNTLHDEYDSPEWNHVDRVEHLELNDLWMALDTLHDEDQTPKSSTLEHREIFIRQRIWWAYNCKKFESTNEIDSWQENCLNLIMLLDLENNDQRCMAAELHRNLCHFSRCLELINELPERYNGFKSRMREECKKANPLTVQLNERKKETEEEDSSIVSVDGNIQRELSDRLLEKTQQDDATADNALEFYRSFAENCSPEAQYQLGRLYLCNRFYNLSEAHRWINYAAFQGHEAAIAELGSFEIDDDGRYDAWA